VRDHISGMARPRAASSTKCRRGYLGAEACCYLCAPDDGPPGHCAVRDLRARGLPDDLRRGQRRAGARPSTRSASRTRPARRCTCSRESSGRSPCPSARSRTA
jgi:hypothetical protein